jgi:hypothetical protein
MVPGWTKLIPVGAVLYILLPVDIVPDVFLGLGQLDDLGVLLLGLRAFIAVCPRAAVLRHSAAIHSVDGVARQTSETPTEVIAGTIPFEGVGVQTVEGSLALPEADKRNESAGGPA